MSGAEERWLPVVGYEGWYEVSDLGRVRRIRDRIGRPMERLLRWSPSKFEYPTVGIFDRARPIHLLVADAFLGPRLPGFEVDHVDGDRNNPKLSNLEIVTRAENITRAMNRRYPNRPPAKGWAPFELPWDPAIHGDAMAEVRS